MMKLTTRFCVFALFIFTLVISGCDTFKANRETITTQEHNLALISFFDAFKTVEEGVRTYNQQLTASSNGGLYTTDCGSAALSDTSFPKTVTIDFGADNCTDQYDITRRGMVSATFSDDYDAQGSSVTVMLTNYYVNNYFISGGLNIMNAGTDADGNVTYDVTVTNAVITDENDHEVSWSAELTFTWTAGDNSDSYIWDDIYSISGNAVGTNSDGREFSANITNLVMEYGCRWPKSGSESIEIDELKDRSVDYGNEEDCDNVAEVTIGGKRRTLTTSLR